MMSKQCRGWIVAFLGLGLLGLAYQIIWLWRPDRDDYSRLRQLLSSGQWEAADIETSKLILYKASRRSSFDTAINGVSFSEFADFPCEDLITIDQLWIKYSRHHFGFSIQQSIWQPTATQITAQNILDNQNRFRENVGWGDSNFNERSYSLKAPQGHLPSSLWLTQASPKLDGMNVYKLDRLLSRTKECYLQKDNTSNAVN